MQCCAAEPNAQQQQQSAPEQARAAYMRALAAASSTDTRDGISVHTAGANLTGLGKARLAFQSGFFLDGTWTGDKPAFDDWLNIWKRFRTICIELVHCLLRLVRL